MGIARFEGSAVRSGHTFSHPDGAGYPFPCFEADAAPATIRIDRFTIHRNLSDAMSSARLVEVISLAGSGG